VPTIQRRDIQESRKINKMSEADYQMDQSFPMVWNYLPFTITYTHSLTNTYSIRLGIKGEFGTQYA